MLELDHLVIDAADLSEGVAAIEAALGISLAPGGAHALMATHNRLLSLGPGVYLEVIAIDASAPRPPWPRWYGLDGFSGPPRLTNWAARCGDLAAELLLSPNGAGAIHDLARGDYRWRMAIPETGQLPFDDAFPALLEWQGPLHPADCLPESGCRLRRLIVTHPRADALRTALADRLSDPRILIETGAQKALRAEIETPHGLRVLQ